MVSECTLHAPITYIIMRQLPLLRQEIGASENQWALGHNAWHVQCEKVPEKVVQGGSRNACLKLNEVCVELGRGLGGGMALETRMLL